MTVIAWDGKTLAADKRATFIGMVRTTTKIFRLRCGDLVAISGDGASGLAMVEWLDAGAFHVSFPECQKDRNTRATVSVFAARGVSLFESEPAPMLLTDRYFADGSGRDYALAAMYLGKTAREAVEVACALSADCGNGIDTLEL